MSEERGRGERKKEREREIQGEREREKGEKGERDFEYMKGRVEGKVAQ